MTIITPATEDRHYRRLGVIVLIVFILIVGVWGSLAPLSSAVPAPGKVTVAYSNRTIQHLEGGIIKSILVHDGDYVHIGQTLVELDSTRADSELQIALVQYTELLSQEARLIAERDNKSSVVFSDELNELCSKFPCTLAKEGQLNEFTVRKVYLTGKITMLSQQIDQLNNQLAGLNDSIQANIQLSNSYAQEIKEWKVLFDQQLTDKLHLREIERQKIKTDSDITSSRSEIARIQGHISETRTQILSEKQTFNKEVSQQLNEVQTKISDVHSRINSLRDTLSRTRIVSPVEATVTNLQFHTLGGVIPPAKPILDLVPINEQLIIEGRVSASEINNVRLGQQCEIRFPGFSHIKSLGVVNGKVTHIAADAVNDDTTHTLYYPVKMVVTLEGQQELSRNHLTLRPGIPADSMIVIGSRTMFDYLMHPFKMMFVKSFNEQ
ncbi:MAG: HlyD family type I secretion periplasmic adaptor subunit [Sulfuricurvum sp.]|uniref:HlyD family type I secretion periplasmic adaptor subunit n=1 Tax=Sulfuricurvum sp. TaxID=2025608 RepID=UPI00262B4F73|nr:HlyD family type I secretion periplasmic adaptor subunit [Sulfuricurvum sp.]MDD5159924.1 HlyD family type I secretion periplasmic adaptor subunit [Sulfuricurvum sp.]